MSTVDRLIISEIPPEYTPEQWAAIVAEREALLARCRVDAGTLPDRRDVDENGRILPDALESRRERPKSLSQLLEEFKAIPDEDPPGTSERFMKEIDQERRVSGMRTLFDGYY